MIYSEDYKEHIEYTLASFGRVVLCNAEMTIYRDFGRKQKRKVSLEYLISETLFGSFVMDTYFEHYDQLTIFVVRGQEIVVASKRGIKPEKAFKDKFRVFDVFSLILL